ncbi:hypothetical protein KYY02_31175 [Streptomyces pimonensis]|uniref:Uncharacterized protein n=1 Tax=Streptomyces pimonensis TaxID=2860288 RepID=A0ABV4J7P1_9ACTN
MTFSFSRRHNSVDRLTGLPPERWPSPDTATFGDIARVVDCMKSVCLDLKASGFNAQKRQRRYTNLADYARYVLAAAESLDALLATELEERRRQEEEATRREEERRAAAEQQRQEEAEALRLAREILAQQRAEQQTATG